MSKTMSTMNKDEKRLMLFDMQEHPEKYTDEQVERLLADEEAQEFLRDLAMARMAGKKAILAKEGGCGQGLERVFGKAQ